MALGRATGASAFLGWMMEWTASAEIETPGLNALLILCYGAAMVAPNSACGDCRQPNGR